MKNLSLILMVIASLFLFSCEKPEKPGNIPGMGNSSGELQAESYEFHSDLSLSDFNGAALDSKVKLKSLSTDEVVYEYEEFTQGSGDQVIITVTITNNSSECRTAWLRAGSVFEVNHSGYQNAILLAPVAVCLEGNTQKTVKLYLYCVNLGLEGSDETATYELLGVTTSETMLELIDLLQYKMINYEHYQQFGDVADYPAVRDKLQEIVWEITNGDGLEDEDKDYINQLPMLPEGTYPDGIYDLSAELPACWCVKECTGTGALSYVAFINACFDTPTVTGGNTYSTNGFDFIVETNWNFNGAQLSGAIKFEENGDQIGEDGEVETGTFSFTTTCASSAFQVITKNKDEEFSLLNTANIGVGVEAANGFTITLLSVVNNGSDYTYTFEVESDNCSGKQKK